MSDGRVLEDGLLRVLDAAKQLGLSRSKVYQLMDRGELPFAKFGRSRRIPRNALRMFIQQHIVDPTDLLKPN